MDEIRIREYLFRFENVFDADEPIYYVSVHVYKNSIEILEKICTCEFSAKKFVEDVTKILTA